MKKIFIGLLSAALLTSVSCSKEETNNSNNSNQPPAATLSESLPGTWNVTKVEEKNGTMSMNGMTVTFSGIGKDYNATFQFKANGEYVTAGSYTMDLTMSMMGTNIPQTIPVNMAGSGTWSVTSAGKLKVSDGVNPPMEYTVLSHTANKVELKASITKTTTFQGQSSTSTVDGFVTLEK